MPITQETLDAINAAASLVNAPAAAPPIPEIVTPVAAIPVLPIPEIDVAVAQAIDIKGKAPEILNTTIDNIPLETAENYADEVAQSNKAKRAALRAARLAEIENRKNNNYSILNRNEKI